MPGGLLSTARLPPRRARRSACNPELAPTRSRDVRQAATGRQAATQRPLSPPTEAPPARWVLGAGGGAPRELQGVGRARAISPAGGASALGQRGCGRRSQCTRARGVVSEVRASSPRAAPLVKKSPQAPPSRGAARAPSPSLSPLVSSRETRKRDSEKYALLTYSTSASVGRGDARRQNCRLLPATARARY